MIRWFVWSVLVFGLVATHPAYSQDREADLAADVESGAGGKPVSKPAEQVSISDSDTLFPSITLPPATEAITVPTDSEDPQARAIAAHFTPAKLALTDKVGQCYFLFLRPPTYSRIVVKTEFAPIAIRNFDLEMKGAKIRLSHANYPKEYTDARKINILFDPEKLLTLASNSQFKERKNSKLVARSEIKYRGYPAMDQVFSYPESNTPDGDVVPAGVVFGRCVLSDRDLFVIGVSIDKASYEIDPPVSKRTAKRFMDSLTIVERQEKPEAK